ncbi:MAG: hypothetical protein E6G97_11280 [Alphaproteobacteria bacterium]|nr:MAG: hypothetical protein E6G97_11280 [Alphaproteobacteria bacterium]
MSLILDSVTTFPPDARGRAAIAASHGGVYAAYLAARAGIKAVILCDAGVGRERAGIGGLDYLDKLGVAAAAIGHRSARIGHGGDCHARGLITFANVLAAMAGVTPGMTASEALDRLERADAPPCPPPPPIEETRHRLSEAEAGGVRVHAIDSAGLVLPEDAGHIVATGSHGALLGGKPETAIKIDVFAALYNDADFGMEDAGIARLPVLEARGIAGACVSAWSARIGDGQSTWRDGFVTAVNARAAQCGGEIGISARELVARLAAARMKELT